MSKKPPPFTKALVRKLGVTEAAAVSSLNTGVIPRGVAPPGSKRAREMVADVRGIGMGNPRAVAAARAEARALERIRQGQRYRNRVTSQEPGMVSVLSVPPSGPPGAISAAAPAPAPAPGADAGSGAAAPSGGGRRRRRNTKKISRRHRRRQHKTRHRRF